MKNSGATVFPGGILDPGDSDSYALADGLDDAEASRRLGLPANGLNFWVAAVRDLTGGAGVDVVVEHGTRTIEWLRGDHVSMTGGIALSAVMVLGTHSRGALLGLAAMAS